jgi:hypothetical protein
VLGGGGRVSRSPRPGKELANVDVGGDFEAQSELTKGRCFPLHYWTPIGVD